MTDAFTNPDAAARRALLREVRRIAVVGLSPRPDRPSHQVARALQDFGYRILPVRPAVERILDEPAFPDLHALPEPVDLVNVFLAPKRLAAIVDACIELSLPRLWLQEGVVDAAQARRAQAAGITVVMDRCIRRDYLALIGT